MKTNFESYLLGLYDNKSQAQSHPTEFSQICLLWEKIVDGYESKHYYRREGPGNPYRHRYHKIVEMTDTEVVVENYSLNWTRQEGCDMIFTFKDSAWHGKLKNPGQCIVRENTTVISEIHLTRDGIDSRDQGYNTEGDKVFGGTLMYKFKRGRVGISNFSS